MVSKQILQEKLKLVKEPVFNKSMLDLGLLSEIQTEGATVKLTVRLSAVGRAYRERIQQAIAEAIHEAGAEDVQITWDVQIPARQLTGDDAMPEVRNVVLIMSGKGGVGKSTVAANLAVALAMEGARVGLLDADIYGPSMPTMFGVCEPPVSKDGKQIEPLEQHGVRLMSIGFMLEDPKSAVVWRGPMLHGALQQFVRDVNWGELDYLLMDLPPGTGDVALTLAQKVRLTGALVVTTPQEIALQDVYKSVSMCKKLNIPILGVIENMSYFTDSANVRQELFGKGGGQSIADFAEAPLLAQLPLDPHAREWGDRGTPVVKSAGGTAIGQAFIDLAEKLSTQVALRHFESGGGERAPSTQGPTRLRIVR